MPSPCEDRYAAHLFTAEPGCYRLEAGVAATTDVENSFYIRIDDGPTWLWDVEVGPFHTETVTDRDTGVVTVCLDDAPHVVTVYAREHGTMLDWLALRPEAEPTPTPAPSYHGVVRIPREAWQTARDGLGADFVEFTVRPNWPDSDITDGLDTAQNMGLQVLLHIHDTSQPTDVPWSPSAGVTARGAEILRLVEGHPALWAVYGFEEPFDYTSEGYVSPDEQRALYAAIKATADVPLYSDMATIARAESEGLALSDGMCDVCCVAPTHWPDDPTARLDAEVDTWRRLMPGSQLAVMVNVYEALPGYAMPTAGQLRNLAERLCALGLPYLYYPWQHGAYGRTLADVEELWPVIAEGCP
jgi:hypothetical protein